VGDTLHLPWCIEELSWSEGLDADVEIVAALRATMLSPAATNKGEGCSQCEQKNGYKTEQASGETTAGQT
jgi:hypothetical protein